MMFQTFGSKVFLTSFLFFIIVEMFVFVDCRQDYSSDQLIPFKFSIILCKNPNPKGSTYRNEEVLSAISGNLTYLYSRTDWFRKMEPKKFTTETGIALYEKPSQKNREDACKKLEYTVYYLCCIRNEDGAPDVISDIEQKILESCTYGEFGSDYGNYQMNCEEMKLQMENNLENIKIRVADEKRRHKCYHPCECECRSKLLRDYPLLSTTVGALVGLVGAAYAFPFMLGSLGFGAAGVKGGSIAAAIMAWYGSAGVPAGGLFALCQSIGVTGVGYGGGFFGTLLGLSSGKLMEYLFNCRC